MLRTATTAILDEEALGAHMQDRNDERIDWARRAMQAELDHELPRAGSRPRADAQGFGA